MRWAVFRRKKKETMQSLMLVAEALAEGAYASGARLVSAVADTATADAVAYLVERDEEQFVHIELSANEKVALEVAYGASVSGARALCLVSSAGLNVAADPFFAAAAGGVRGGLVIVSVDDPGMEADRRCQDSRPFGCSARIPVLETSYSHEALVTVVMAFDMSERFDTPVMVRCTRRTMQTRSLTRGYGVRKGKNRLPYLWKPDKFCVTPDCAQLRSRAARTRLERLRLHAEIMGLNRVEMRGRKLGIITSGICYTYAREALPEASILKLGMIHPLPQQKIWKFASQVDRLVVVEEMEPVIEQQIRAMGIACEGKELLGADGEYSVDLLEDALIGRKPVERPALRDLPDRPPGLCAGCPHRFVLHALRTLRARVVGDMGCSTLGAFAPLETLDTALCLGASIGMAHGMFRGNPDGSDGVVAVLGDGAFLHSGVPALLNMVAQEVPATVLILDNGACSSTGPQPYPGSGRSARGASAPKADLEQLIRALGVANLQVLDPTDLSRLRSAVSAAMGSAELEVVLVRKPCDRLRLQAAPAPFEVTEACSNCGDCRTLGCPAICRSDGASAISAAECVGCSLCAQVCPSEAIVRSRAV